MEEVTQNQVEHLSGEREKRTRTHRRETKPIITFTYVHPYSIDYALPQLPATNKQIFCVSPKQFPVSYTHLDVYKRQSLEDTPRITPLPVHIF